MSTEDVMLTHYIDSEQLKKDIAINPSDLSGNLQQHAALYVHYATQGVRARRQYERYKAALEILEAQLDSEYRTSLAVEGKKPTEASIKAAIASDNRWRSASVRLIDAQQVWKLAEVAERAFEQRKDTLLQMARDASREREGQLRILEVSGGRDRLTAAMRAQTEANAATAA